MRTLLVTAVAAVVSVTAAAPAPELIVRFEQALPPTYNQGLARVDGGWIVSGTNAPAKDTDVIARIDDLLNVTATAQPAIPEPYRGQGYNHVGDIDVVGNVIYAPFEQPNYDLGHQVMARYDATTLAFIDATELPQHENSFVTVDPATMTAYSMDHFDGDSLTRYDVNAGWKPLPPLQLTMLLHSTQGADIAGGDLFISTSDPNNDVFRVDVKTGQTATVGTLGHVGAEGEGFDASRVAAGGLHALINDPRQQQVDFVHYDLGLQLPDEPAAAASSHAWVWAIAGAVAVLAVVLAGFFGVRAWRRRDDESSTV